jgi:hypothetical protein
VFAPSEPASRSPPVHPSSHETTQPLSPSPRPGVVYGTARVTTSRQIGPSTKDAAHASPPRSVRHEIGLALGVIVGLAGLVQGFDSASTFRTTVGALLVGLVGLALIYLLPERRR